MNGLAAFFIPDAPRSHPGRGYLCIMTFIAPHYQKARNKSWFPFLRTDHFLVKTPGWLKLLYPDCQWEMEEKEKTLYLSFDDGPHPAVTPFVLSQLRTYNARATFFCIGENVARYPDVYRQILDEGHAVGNHTQHHINGWKTGDNEYLADILAASDQISSAMFRPPYGRISRSQIRKLRSTKTVKGEPYAIIMWNILAGDWVSSMSPEKCYSRIENRISPGDIIVFHDSEKAWDRMSYCLPRVLEKFAKAGFSFKIIQGK